MKLQKLLSFVRRCDADFKLIAAGDRVAVGLSGGKDSLVLNEEIAMQKKNDTNGTDKCR